MLGNLIRDKGREGRRGYTLPKLDVEETNLDEVLPKKARRKEKPRLPEMDEPTVIRHYTNLSRQNWGIDTNFYPLGSCTMKHNPRANEAAAAVPGFAGLHPLQTEDQAQGALRVMHEVQGFLAEISGLPAVSLQPMAGAQGELASILMIRKYFEDAGDHGRTAVIVPETAHGTNPATATMANFKAVEVGLDEHGCVDVDELREMVDETTAALMITNPNTCGVYERNIKEISRGPARGRRLPLHGRGEHERQHGPDARRRRRRGHHALQPAQDLLDPPRRRRSRLRAPSPPPKPWRLSGPIP